MNLDAIVTPILQRHTYLAEKLAEAGTLSVSELTSFSKEHAQLSPLVVLIHQKTYLEKEKQEALLIIEDELQESAFRALATQTYTEVEAQLQEVYRGIKKALLPKDIEDEKNAILEVRAGTGGEEAALFASTLFHMYQAYAVRRKWKFEIISIAETGLGGYKEAIASVKGRGVFAYLKYEGGVHRVQRVPKTESQGRIHTSAATVAVLPEMEELEIHIDEKELRIDVFRAQGAGGQHVNTTESAVRIVHIPTGITVTQQDEKSQHQNRAKALRILQIRLYEQEREKRERESAEQRRMMVGTGDRSERIRTYNFPQGRVTDHRIELTLYQIEDIIQEGNLDPLITALMDADEIKKLETLNPETP